MSKVPVNFLNQGPLVTVYIPCRNYGRYLAQAVASVQQQLYQAWELFIIDEASDDETFLVAQRFAESEPERIRVIRHEQAKGLQHNANRVLELAAGKYIMRLDADDWLEESALLLMIGKLESDPSLGLVYGNYFYTNENGQIIGIERRRKFGAEETSGNLPPHGACTMVRTRSLKVVGGYSEDINAQDGWELWFKLLNRVGVANLEAPLFYYRQHSTSLSRDPLRLLQARAKIKAKTRERLAGTYTPSCLAVIPVKESYPNFEGVPYVKINGVSLLERAILSSSVAHGVTAVAVSSSCDKVLAFALEIGAKYEVQVYPVKRPDDLSGPTLKIREVLLHANEAWRNESGVSADFLLFLSLHVPFRTARHLEEAIDTLLIQECDTVVTVNEEREPIFLSGKKGLELVNPGRFDDLEYERERIFRFNGSIIGVWQEVLLTGEIFQGKIGYVEMSRSESYQVKEKEDVVALHNVLATLQQPLPESL